MSKTMNEINDPLTDTDHKYKIIEVMHMEILEKMNDIKDLTQDSFRLNDSFMNHARLPQTSYAHLDFSQRWGNASHIEKKQRTSSCFIISDTPY